MIDLRSDTVTRPSAAMRRAMAEAPVGDDVFGDDPTVNRLQEKVAELLGKEAAIYVPSGSMGNQTSIRAQTQPGDEIIAHADSHIYHYEAGAPGAISGCSLRLLPGEGGLFDAAAVRAAVRPSDSHYPRSALVVVENTHNRGGGTCWSIDEIAAIHGVAEEFGLKMHLDGARLMNACVAKNHKPTEYAKYFDTVSICFSKGLGAPVGSAVASTKDTIRRVHRFRKMFGGGMRQAGIIAAAALYALENNVARLAEDHANANRLATGIANIPKLSVNVASVETNIVYFDVDPSYDPAKTLCDAAKEEGVWILSTGPQRIRAVTHLDVSTKDMDQAIATLDRIIRKR
ncbi:MAG: aminotransferase class I/II-fold pyridoxal phosphate-dependent enzyme [Planctomycetes bacterium]|nr:aminotransferase class I/II-fold pyridoxal phosphate-dependent enzyme [Planctomycetota bacterium]MBI3834667.1 aminotransferase class I/II-fold pyridoxal phosphate-dependent enzyme [Planctomycetota bacterium]